jgi:hypothetical protein
MAALTRSFMAELTPLALRITLDTAVTETCA